MSNGFDVHIDFCGSPPNRHTTDTFIQGHISCNLPFVIHSSADNLGHGYRDVMITFSTFTFLISYFLVLRLYFLVMMSSPEELLAVGICIHGYMYSAAQDLKKRKYFLDTCRYF